MDGKVRFKDLAVGEVFEFDHSTLAFHRDLNHGPWQKVSARRYACVDVNAERGNLTGPVHLVGTGKAFVRRGTSCGGDR